MDGPAERLLQNARREAIIVLFVWLGFIVWVIVCCARLGYRAPGDAQAESQVSLRGGLPAWVFWGIAIPWACATLLTIFLGAALIRDDELGSEREETRSEAD